MHVIKVLMMYFLNQTPFHYKQCPLRALHVRLLRVPLKEHL